MKQHESTIEQLPEDLRAYLEAVPQVSHEDLSRLEETAQQMEDDPAFQADYLKSLVIEKLLAAMEENQISQSQLAQLLGKSRQYVSKLFNEDKRVNFTIETMTKLAQLVGRRLELQIVSPGEISYVMHYLPSMRRNVPSKEALSKTVQNLHCRPNDLANYKDQLAGQKIEQTGAYDSNLAA